MKIQKLSWPTKSEACPHRITNPENPAQEFEIYLDENFDLCIEFRGSLRIEKYSSTGKLKIVLDDEP